MSNNPGLDALYSEKVLMHGPAFDGTGDIVEREVPRADVTAYRNAGYADGPNPTKSIADVVEKFAGRFTYTEADAIAQNDGVDVTKTKKRK